MDSGSTATNIGAGNVFGAFLPFVLAAIIIFIVLFLIYWLLKGKPGVKTKGGFFEVLASQVIDQHNNIHLIKYLERYYIIISSAGSAQVIEEIQDKSEKEQIDLKFAEKGKSPFSKILNKKVFEDQIKRLDKISD